MLAKRWANVADDGAALYQLLLKSFLWLYSLIIHHVTVQVDPVSDQSEAAA